MNNVDSVDAIHKLQRFSQNLSLAVKLILQKEILEISMV